MHGTEQQFRGENCESKEDHILVVSFLFKKMILLSPIFFTFKLYMFYLISTVHWLVSISLMAPSNKRRPNNPLHIQVLTVLKFQQRCTILQNCLLVYSSTSGISRKLFPNQNETIQYASFCGILLFRLWSFSITDFDEMLTNKRELF